MSDYINAKRHVLVSTETGYKPLSYWTKAEDVEFDSGTDLESEISSIKSDTNKKSDSSLTLAAGTADEITVTASQMQDLVNLLSLTTWTGGSY